VKNGGKMGDGRYYTPNQFYNIIYLTILIIFIIISGMLYLYKGSNNKMRRSINWMFGVLGLIVFGRFCQEVVVSEQFASRLELVISSLFVILQFMYIRFHLIYILNVYKVDSMSIITKVLPYTFVGLVFGVGLFKPILWIKRFTFGYTEYGSLYCVMILISGIFLIYISLVVIIKHDDIEGLKNIWKAVLLHIVLLWIVPLLIYAFVIIGEVNGSKSIEHMIYLLMAISFSHISVLFRPFRVNSTVFSDIKNLMMDYVFIVDNKGVIIYRNSSVVKSVIFRTEDIINIKDVGTFFKSKVIMRDDYNKKMVHIEGDINICLGYQIKPIKTNRKIAGYIITFTELTKLVEMLDILKLKQEETLAANEKLSLYKDIVYGVEKEKEISTLLNEIAENQYKSMVELKEKIEKLEVLENSEFIENISEIIIEVKEDLQDVRKAVTAYMSYYDE